MGVVGRIRVLVSSAMIAWAAMVVLGVLETRLCERFGFFRVVV